MARLHLVRHGETDWNAQKRYQGSIDIPLNERGRSQAKEVGKDLANLSFSAVYASTLSRARETAELILAAPEQKIHLLDTLKEGSFGQLEGKSYEEVHIQYASSIEARKKLSARDKLHFKLIPDEESWHEVLERVLPTLEEIAKRHEGEEVLVVTHGGVIRTLLVHLADYEEFPRIENGQVVRFLYQEGRLVHTP